MSITIGNPFAFFTDSDGSPLDSGYIYIGTANLNPEVSAIPVYWDSALSIPAAQPIRTMSGYAVRNGTPATFYTAANDYSITVKNQKSSIVYTQLSAKAGITNSASNISFTGRDGGSYTVQDLSGNNGAYIIGYRSNRSVGTRLDDLPSIADQTGIVGDGVADDLTPITNALAASPTRKVLAPVYNWNVSARPLNPQGTRLIGKGKILLPTAYGPRQLNTYANDTGLALRKEYLYKMFARLKIDGQLQIQLYGDSTIAGHNGENPDFYVDNLMPMLFSSKGYANVLVQNYGVAGTKWTDLNAIPNIDATGANATDVIVLKYGINDVQDINAVYNTMRSKISAIRAATNGGYPNLSIVVMMPTSTYDIAHNRDARWYEQLRDMYVAVCEEFQCAFFDSYALLQDTSRACTYWQDNPFGDGVNSVHMLDVGQTWLWGAFVDWLFQDGETRQFAKNKFVNAGAASGQPLAAGPITNYNFGNSRYRATPTNGWPADGYVDTWRAVDGGGMQTLFTFGSSAAGRIYKRWWNIAGAAWTSWTGQLNTPTLLNGWTAFGSTRKSPVYYRDDNMGYLRGTIKGGTTTVATVLMTLPADFRPATNSDQIFVCRGSASNVAIGINSAGNVFLQTAGDATETCLDGMSWIIGS